MSICLPAFILALLAGVARLRAAAAACRSRASDVTLQTMLHILVPEVLRPVGGNAHRTILMVSPHCLLLDNGNGKLQFQCQLARD